MQPTIQKALERAWNDVEAAYKDEKLNSERALQSVIYCSLTSILPRDQFTVLVEPTWVIEPEPELVFDGGCVSDFDVVDGAVPDLVVVDVKLQAVACLIELKFAPHWWHPRAKILEDLYKLSGYWKSKGRKVRLDVFGPERIFDPRSKKWLKDQPRFHVLDNALLVFADIDRSDSIALEKASYAGENGLDQLFENPNFLYLRGEIDQVGNGTGDRFYCKQADQMNCRR